MVKLFLDDVRIPYDCLKYMLARDKSLGDFYNKKDGVIVKTCEEFKKYLENNKLPDVISMDHDLADSHYKSDDPLLHKELTGYDCLEGLIWMCKNTNTKLPKIIIHSMNPIGRTRMEQLIKENNI